MLPLSYRMCSDLLICPTMLTGRFPKAFCMIQKHGSRQLKGVHEIFLYKKILPLWSCLGCLLSNCAQFTMVPESACFKCSLIKFRKDSDFLSCRPIGGSVHAGKPKLPSKARLPIGSNMGSLRPKSRLTVGSKPMAMELQLPWLSIDDKGVHSTGML